MHFQVSKTAVLLPLLLLVAVGISFAQQQVNLTAAPTSLTLPDGSSVPMWGYSCTTLGAGAVSTATCAALHPGTTGWSPVVITVPTGQDLQINLTNSLLFANGNKVPTSLVIVGQLGGGLGTTATTTPSPVHAQQQTTWPVATAGPVNNPPPQGPRVQSFSTEVAPGAVTSLTWTKPRAGTYLIESGTHPSIQGPMGLYGILVVTTAPLATPVTAGTAYPGVTYNAEVPLLFSEIDPVQNNSVNTAVNTLNFSETAVWSGQPGGCGNPASTTFNTCYPPAVNYTPLYYLINGVAFNKTNGSASLFAAVPGSALAPITGNVLVRLVNAGVRMHVPSIVGSQTGTTVVGGFSLIAEDGNPLPGVHRPQSEVFMAAGKTYDVMVNVPAAGATALPVYDRELSLSGNGTERDAGMLAYISINGSGLPTTPALAAAVANPDTYNSVVAGQTLTVSDPSLGVIANDINVYGVKASTLPTQGTLTLNTNGTFTYVAAATWSGSDSFVYCGNGAISGPTCATVTLGAAAIESSAGITVNNITYTSKMATFIKIASPGVLSVDSDAAGYPLKVALTSVSGLAACSTSPAPCVSVDQNGGFLASVSSAGTYTFTYKAQNSQGTLSSAATVTLVFPAATGLKVNVVDGKTGVAIAQDYRWIIEEDRSFFIDPTKTTNNGPNSPIVPILGVNFHTSDMPYVAQGCTGPLSCESGQTIIDPATGKHVPAVCDVGNGACRPDTTGNGKTPVLPGQVALDPTKRYYISVLPGDAANPFQTGNTTTTCAPSLNGISATCGHSMGGAPIAPGQTSVTVIVEQDPFPTAKLSVNVFEDDFPLNGEQDAGGGVDVLASNEPGLGGFNIILWDDAGGSGDFTGQMTYDMFNMPLGNSLDGQIDPNTGLNACPITKQGQGITGMIVTCPKFESDGKTLSPLAGQAVVANLMPGRFSVQAIPGADRIARGEEWLQTNTLDGQKQHDSFLRIGEPSFFQEFGPGGFHVSIGFANPKIINSRLAGVCKGTDPTLTAGNCVNSLTGKVTTSRMSRVPDERLYGSGSRDSFFFTQCYVSVGDPDGEDFAFTKCAADGTFSFTGLPTGTWRITTFDQWNDQIVDGLSTPVGLGDPKALCPGPGSTVNSCNMGDIAVQQWQANVYTRTFIDDNKDGVSQATEAGIPLVNTSVRYRDGSLANNLVTDFNGIANFNETFPLFNWYVVETDTTRYKTTGIHTVYDAGGPADGTTACGQPGFPQCGTSTIGKFLANTFESNPLPSNLSVPGAVYCSDADCTGSSIKNGPTQSSTTNHSTGRIDPPWVAAEGWQGFSGQNNFIEFGKTPYVTGENGGIHGHVIYASTRPFDDPQMLVQTQWEPLVPHVTINLYQEGKASDGVTPTLKLVDTTQTSSWDDWAQGFRTDGVPNMNCPGQSTADLFYFSLFNQPSYLDLYNNQHGGTPVHTLPNNSQYKCYDGMHNWNQLQPAPYDGMYSFPSVTGINPLTARPTGTNCTVCIANPDVSDPYRAGTPMLPPGKYVVEVVMPPGYEIVKEEDKNILIGDSFIAPVTQQFGNLASIFIIPDQAQVGSHYNANSFQNQTQSLGANPNNGIVPGFVPEPTWPCVGAARIVPDFISLFPQSKEVAPFAGATRNLCDRKEVTLTNQMGAIAKFYIYTSTHKAAKFTGVITDDFTSEFDPFSPSFGEKFAPPNMPISVKDWTGAEIGRVYSDWWGDFDGLTYSTWEVNPPNPTGYSPTMMVFCMNDKGPIPNPTGTGTITDPLFNPGYSQFCYELPFMPGSTQYLDTPVVPTSAFSAGYNHPDCSYPDTTPAISEVDGDGVGPWVSAPGKTLTIHALGNQPVPNYGFSGPSATTAPFNAQTVTRHYGFGASQGTGSVTIGGVTARVLSWSDTLITVAVPAAVPACGLQQQAQFGGPGSSPTVTHEQCGQLVITAANGKQSVDAVTVTIGGKTPTVLVAGATIQSAIDSASPGDLIIIPPGTYREMLLMWKPVRLQGVGSGSVTIDANTHPAGKLDPWRRQVNCLIGLALNGQPSTGNGPVSTTNTNPFDPTSQFSCPGTGWTNFSGVFNNPQIDRMPLEGVLGWDTSVNGNLAELLQEPTLMGAYEGAGITILAKGVNTHGAANYYGTPAAAASYPAGTTLLTIADCASGTGGSNPYPSNFSCNPSRIDGLSITNSSQGGGGIFAHGWNHNLEIANNRVFGNIGTLSGGINIGQSEFPEAYLQGSATNSPPGSCVSSALANQQLPYCFNLNVQVHNNAVTANTSIGDEAFSGTPAGAGGVTFCSGSDFYKFNHNWVCGNMSTGDGGGVAHAGFIWNGAMEHNTILFNQSLNPTIPANGGGIVVLGAPPDGNVPGTTIECGTTVDVDCVPGLSDGTGPGLVINANLIMGNAAESGTGGGLRFQAVNGTEVINFPKTPSAWNKATVTNNIIANNVAGWDGAGISLEDALAVNIINNTIVSNDATATAGVLFNTLGAPLASGQSPPPTQTTSGTTSAPQPAGLASMRNSAQLTSALAGLPAGTTLTCPANHSGCAKFSDPYLANNVFWQNRSFFVAVGALSTAFQQNVVTLHNARSGSLVASQSQADATTANGRGVIITGGTGACVSGSTYWDVGVRGDTGPGNHASGFTLAPIWSVLTSASENGLGSHNIHSNPTVVSQYCNGSRVPPEFARGTFNVPPGISDATVPNPLFSLIPTATVDEGNNWVNLTWGPLSVTHPTSGAQLGDYALAQGSPAIDHIPPTASSFAAAPRTDFFGRPRPDANEGNIDVGAVEFLDNAAGGGGGGAGGLNAASPNFGRAGASVPITITGANLAGAQQLLVSGAGINVTNFQVVNNSTLTATLVIAPTAALTRRTLSVLARNGVTNSVPFTVTGPPALRTVAPNAGVHGTAVPVVLTGANLNGATNVTVSGSGVTVSNFVLVNDTTVRATLNIAATAPQTARSLVVVTPGGNTGSVTFTVH